MILLFNPEIPDLNNKLTITMENLKYQSILKRFKLFIFLNKS